MRVQSNSDNLMAIGIDVASLRVKYSLVVLSDDAETATDRLGGEREIRRSDLDFAAVRSGGDHASFELLRRLQFIGQCTRDSLALLLQIQNASNIEARCMSHNRPLARYIQNGLLCPSCFSFGQRRGVCLDIGIRRESVLVFQGMWRNQDRCWWRGTNLRHGGQDTPILQAFRKIKGLERAGPATSRSVPICRQSFSPFSPQNGKHYEPFCQEKSSEMAGPGRQGFAPVC